MILEGTTFEKLLTSGRKPNAAQSHLNHLKTEHGLPVEKIDGIFGFIFEEKTEGRLQAFRTPGGQIRIPAAAIRDMV
jgi:hypothetical protein